MRVQSILSGVQREELTAINNEHWHQQAAYRDTNGDGDVDITIGNPDGTEEIQRLVWLQPCCWQL